MNRKITAGILMVGMLSGGAILAQTGKAQTATTQDTQKAQEARDQDIQLLRQDIRSKKKQLIAANLKLTDTEATKFWPVYDQYTADLIKINNDKYALMKEYADNWGTMTDEQAVSLTNRALAVDEKVAALRTHYVPVFMKVIDGKKTATFFQLDRRIQSMIDLQLSAQFPLVQAQD
jgi:hypothetical protein